MREQLELLYEQELDSIRRLAAEFARDRPKIADRLAVEHDTGISVDPHVERLIEAFAFLTARVRLKLEDEFPELTDSLLGILYPHYLAPVPSMAVAQFQLDPDQGLLTNGYTVPRHSRLTSREVEGIPCRFRTAYPVTLWPVEIASAQYHTAPFGGLRLPPGMQRAEALIRFELRAVGGAQFHQLELDRLRFFLSGDERTTNQLYELLFNHRAGIAVQVHDGRSPVPRVLPADSVRDVGFERDESLLPYDNRSFPGYRLLTEYFAFPSKFLFVDLLNLAPVVREAATDRIDILFFLSKADRNLETRVDRETFRLGCAPVVNLFRQSADPIRLTQTRTEYHVLPDARHPRAVEVYSIDAVQTTDRRTGGVVDYEPFFACRHGREPNARQTYWYAKRVPSNVAGDRGTEVWLSLVDLAFQPSLPATEVVNVTTTCTNRDLPGELRRSGGASWGFQLEGQAPLRRIDPVVPPTTPSRLPHNEARWRLISHLALNHLSITDADAGADALREILRLYDYTNTRVTAAQIAGIESVRSQRKTARISTGPASGFCRGVEIAVQLNPERFAGTGVYLFASVLDRFLALYASINSFTRLVTSLKGSTEPFRSWPYRVGEQTLL